MIHLALLQATPSPSAIGAIIGFVFLVMLVGTAFLAWKALKTTARMGFRLAVVMVIMAIGVAGAVTFWWYASDAKPKIRVAPKGR